MGNGPARLHKEIAKLVGVASELITVGERPFELGTTINILRTLSAKVSSSTTDHRLPILLAGGCINTVGAIAGIDSDSMAVVWFDAHADFNTPETTVSGFTDGMALAMLTGRCWTTLTASIPGFRPLSEKNVVLIGARDLDPEERRSLEGSEVRWIQEESIRNNGVEDSLRDAIGRLPERLYVHLDLDVLDLAEARVNEYSSTGGITVDELLKTIRFIGSNRTIVGAAITAYDPSVDHDSKALNAAVAAVKSLLAAACIDVTGKASH